MGTYIKTTQFLGETRTHPVKISPDLLASAVPTSGSAAHTPPTGGIVETPTVTLSADNIYAYVTLPLSAANVRGVHKVKAYVNVDNVGTVPDERLMAILLISVPE